MKPPTERPWFKTSHPRDYLDITGTVEKLVYTSGVQAGL